LYIINIYINVLKPEPMIDSVKALGHWSKQWVTGRTA